MTPADTLAFAARTTTGAPMRSLLLILAMSIGMAAVVILTALGDGIRTYIIGQFVSLGTNLVIITPGRNDTGGFQLGSLITPRALTIEDASALQRVPYVRRVAPVLTGYSEVAANSRLRETMVMGTTSGYFDIRRFAMSQGNFLPDEDWLRSRSVAVIGATIADELFGTTPPIGQMIRIGDNRLRVIGVLARIGQGLGFKPDEHVIVPVATSLVIFNTNSLHQILLETTERDTIEPVRKEAEQFMKTLHAGELDVTLITQDAVLEAFDDILDTSTMVLVGIASISLVVAGILVMNVMLVSVTQRTAEIGVLKALGASNRNIISMFLTEATLLSFIGALAGLVLGYLGTWIIRIAWPDIPVYPTEWAILSSLAVALCSGLIFGVLPARRAAALDPVLALSGH